MYKKVSTDLDFVTRELEVIDFWQANKIFELSAQLNDGKPKFSFYDGPPTANGKPHIGHVLTRAMKDLIPRYKTMKGYSVLRKAGWDTHGLPVELEVEKQLKINGKQAIEQYGIEPFITQCKTSVWKYKAEWEQMSQRVGFWADMVDPYITYDNKYIESVWWSLSEIDKKGLLYKGFKIVPYCPRCGTALSSHEVAQGYKEVSEKSIFVKFQVADKPDTFILAWTTTPWTLPSNVALAVNPKETYSTIKVGQVNYILAQALVSNLFTEGSYEVLTSVKGSKLAGLKYKPLFDYAALAANAFIVVCADFVTLTDGTGVVHIAPAFGEDDAAVGRANNLPFVQLVNERGCFTDDVHDIKDVFCKDGDKLIIDKLDKSGLLFKVVDYVHSYPYCWRCDTPLLYYARKSWFVKMTAVKEQMLANNASINWIPPTIGSGRMGNFIENIIDWGISRERYWGTPLPIWVCECGHIHVVGSIAELVKLSGCDSTIELHRPYIDKITFKCSKCNGTMHRTPEVLDCWYDSGSMPFAQFHYPFENKELFESNFPADFISEAVDQTRGWFYTLLAISTLLFNKAPFKNCIVLGHVGDKDGVKMSKHKGNVIDPNASLDKQGSDAVRWYFYTSSAPWLPSRFSLEAVSEAQRSYLGTLWNTYAFFVLYADIDKFNPSTVKLSDVCLTIMDKWILSELNTLIKTVDEGLDNYLINESGRAIENFVDKLSNWYVRRCRERYWASDMTDNKKAAYATLHYVLVTVAKLTAPFTPFIAENIYSNLVANFFTNEPVSVHLSKFPKYDSSYIDDKLEEEMNNAMQTVVLGRSARNSSNIKNRQPLANMYIITDSFKSFSQDMLQIISEELNIKKIQFAANLQQFASYEIKPQLRTLGPKYGALIGDIKQYLAACSDTASIVNTVSSGEACTLKIKGNDVVVSFEDLLITTLSKKGYEAAPDKGVSVVLDTTLNDELICEGIARELVSKVQTMRKDSGFVVTDHIKISFNADELVSRVVNEYAGSIKSDTLCDNIVESLDSQFNKVWDINGHNVTITIAKI